MTDDLSFLTLDVREECDETRARLLSWLLVVQRAFLQGRANEEFQRRWLAAARADGAVLRGVWDSSLPRATSRLPVATFGHFDKTLNVGAAHLPVRMITDVTVAPTHRRRGIMGRLMRENLADAVERGIPVAALTASEGSIYGRFGFGVATRVQRIEVATSPRFALREGWRDTGRVALGEPADLWDDVGTVMERHHRERRGSLDRPASYRDLLTGEFDWERGAADTTLRLAVHHDGAGAPDGYVAYTPMEHQGSRALSVVDLVATTTEAHLALWEFLAAIDLTDRVVQCKAPLAEPLRWSLRDHRVLSVVGEADHVWLRVLDPVAALSARSWFGDGAVALGIEDPLGHAAGTVRVSVTGGTGHVDRARTEPDVTLDVEALGSLLLGDVTVPTLATSGRVRGDAGAVARFAAMADGGTAPHCITDF